jgi:hypothetical protein
MTATMGPTADAKLFGIGGSTDINELRSVWSVDVMRLLRPPVMEIELGRAPPEERETELLPGDDVRAGPSINTVPLGPAVFRASGLLSGAGGTRGGLVSAPASGGASRGGSSSAIRARSSPTDGIGASRR